MPIFSSEISGLVGGQMALFSNQAQYAQQVGAQTGVLPPGTGFGGGMQAPYQNSAPSYARQGYGGQQFGPWSYQQPGGLGAAAVGGMAGAMPGIASGLSMVGGLGLLGSAGYALDPYSMVGGAFARGAGTSGFFGTLGGIGSGFAQGGLRGGLGMIGGGLAAAALPMAGYYAAGKAITHVGENIYAGAQNISQVSNFAQNTFQPSGMSGMRPGGQLPRAEIQGIVTTLHELAGEDVMRTMESMKSLMGKASQMGMLTGVTDAASFKQKFKKVVDQVQSVAKIMGTTLEESMPLLGQMNQMGLWRASDIIGATAAIRTAGPQNQGAILNSMAAGAMGSWQRGGTLGAGNKLGTRQFLNVQSMMQAGTMSEEQLREYTGGTGGTEGQTQLANQMTSEMQSFINTPMGQALMLATGEKVNGRYTGRVDSSLVRGATQMSTGDLLRRGRSRGREGGKLSALSFMNKKDELGQNVISEGGEEMMLDSIKAAVEQRGMDSGDDDVLQGFLQRMTGFDERSARRWVELGRKAKETKQLTQRRMQVKMDDDFRRLDESQNRSLEGLKRAVGHWWEETAERPFQEIGEGLTTSWNETIDRASDRLMGRGPNVALSQGARNKLALSGRSQRSLESQGLNISFRERLTMGGIIPSITGAMRGEDRAGMLEHIGLPVTEVDQYDPALVGNDRFNALGTSTTFRDPDMITTGTGAQHWKGHTSGRTVRGVSGRLAPGALKAVQDRADATSRADLKFSDDAQTNAALDNIKAAYSKIISGGGADSAAWDEIRRKNPEAAHADLLTKMLMERADLKGDFALLAKGRISPGVAGLDAVKAVQLEHDQAGGRNFRSPSFAKAANQFQWADMVRASGGYNEALRASYSEAFGGLAEGTGLSETDISNAIGNEEWGAELNTWLQKGMQGSMPEALRAAAQDSTSLAARVVEGFSKTRSTASGDRGAQLAHGFARARMLIEGKATDEMRASNSKLLQGELRSVSGIKGLSDTGRTALSKALSTASGASSVEGASHEITKLLDSGALSPDDLKALDARGGVTGDFIKRINLTRSLGSGKAAKARGGMNRDELYSGLAGIFGGNAESVSQMLPDDFKKDVEGMLKDSKSPGVIDSDEKKQLTAAIQKMVERLGGKDTDSGREEERAAQEKFLTGYKEATEATTKLLIAVTHALPGVENKGGEDKKMPITRMWNAVTGLWEDKKP